MMAIRYWQQNGEKRTTRDKAVHRRREAFLAMPWFDQIKNNAFCPDIIPSNFPYGVLVGAMNL